MQPESADNKNKTKDVKTMSENVKKSGGWRTNKWIRAAIPALLLHCSIGTVYC